MTEQSFELPVYRITKLRHKLLNCPEPQFIIAGICGIHPSRISEYALGQKPIKNKHLLLLMEYFQCSAEDLVGYCDPPDSVLSEKDYSKEGVFE